MNQAQLLQAETLAQHSIEDLQKKEKRPCRSQILEVLRAMSFPQQDFETRNKGCHAPHKTSRTTPQRCNLRQRDDPSLQPTPAIHGKIWKNPAKRRPSIFKFDKIASASSSPHLSWAIITCPKQMPWADFRLEFTAGLSIPFRIEIPM